MSQSLPHISRVLTAISNIALWLSGIGLVLMTILIACQVFFRYVLNSSPSWTEATATMLMAWFIFLGAAIGVREGFHLGFEILLVSVSPAVARAMRNLSDAIVCLFGIGMVVYGGQLVAGTWSATLPTLGLPGGFVYLPIVAGGALTSLFCLERLAQRMSGIEPAVQFSEG